MLCIALDIGCLSYGCLLFAVLWVFRGCVFVAGLVVVLSCLHCWWCLLCLLGCVGCFVAW